MSRAHLPSPRLLLATALVAVGACQCDDGGVSALDVRLEITPLEIDFGSVPLGVEVRRSVTVSNVGAVAIAIPRSAVVGTIPVRLEAEAPAALPPGSSIALVLLARPTELGLRTGALELSTDAPERPDRRVGLSVTGIEPPPCDDGNTCTEDVFDPVSNACQHRFADGIACQPADRCIVGAVCQNGVCLGSSKSCDDDSPCTRDLCRQIDGTCLNLPDERGCDDDNPCTADACGPEGCTHAPLANGTPCDDGDLCTRGDACFSGVCEGTGAIDGEACDDGDSCTEDDVCLGGRCQGRSRVEAAAEGEVVFRFDLTDWPGGFLHRREVSLGDDGTLFALDHLPLTNPIGLSHVVTTMAQCGTSRYEFAYRPPDSFVLVRYVRREMQLQPDDTLRIVVGVRQLPENGFLPQTTAYVIDRDGNVIDSKIRATGGETGRSLLPDGSHIFGVVWPVGDPLDPMGPRQNLVVVREDTSGQVLWRHERTSEEWAEFLGVAGPRVLFWSEFRFGALDFNTGSLVWSQPTTYIAKEMALSTRLNLGLARVGNTIPRSQILAVELLEGNEVFRFPPEEKLEYLPRTDPIIAADGRIIVIMQRADTSFGYVPTELEFVELGPDGAVLTTASLPYAFPGAWQEVFQAEDDSQAAVTEDGVTFVGFGDSFFSIDPGGQVRFTVTSSIPNAFTGSVPLVRDDGVVLISEDRRRFLGVRSHGGRMSTGGWPVFRHDGRRTNHTP
jgi:outer membrane protein assembly factor BamB